MTTTRTGTTSASERLGRADIVDAAMLVIGTRGLDALTMRALAVELSVTPMAVYHHVSNKGELLQIVADAVIAGVEVPGPETGSWDVRLGGLVRELRARLTEFPGVGPYVLGSDVVMPGLDRLMTATIEMLVDAGFGDHDAALAFTAVHNYLLGRLTVEATLRGPRLERLKARRAGQPQPLGGDFPADEYFEYGLSHLISGLHPSLH
jgi:TetR/AcrR family tetracycline transcriptional repressor